MPNILLVTEDNAPLIPAPIALITVFAANTATMPPTINPALDNNASFNASPIPLNILLSNNPVIFSVTSLPSTMSPLSAPNKAVIRSKFLKFEIKLLIVFPISFMPSVNSDELTNSPSVAATEFIALLITDNGLLSPPVVSTSIKLDRTVRNVFENSFIPKSLFASASRAAFALS